MTDHSSSPSERFERSFIATLIEDVIAADANRKTSDSQPNRRNLIRTIFAALEGAIWICREHVREAAASMGELTPLIDMALRERTYTVTTTGDVVEQVRHITLRAMIRLVVKQAQQLAPSLQVEFSDAGWAKLRAATTIRNRATHPKSINDLVLNDDIAVVHDALSWVLALTEDVVSATVTAQTLYNKDMRQILDALKRGEPAALRDYQLALTQTSDDD